MNRLSKALAAVMLMMMVVFTSGCNKPEDEPNNGGGNGGNTNTHAYVDLGLPSGALWATCNVGATKPEEYGDYFAWGETETKSTYNWSTYKYANGSYDQLTKYCNNSSYGFIDNLTILQLCDDAATANWGNGWRMPNKAQWVELLQNTNHTWTTQNGVNGRLFAASNGNTLFLPAAGDQGGDELYGVGSYGHYWSGSLDTNDPRIALLFNFGSDVYDIGLHIGRCCGLSVRAVRSVRQN